MAHELEIRGGKASFAYNDRQDPWHRLGTPMKGDQTLEAMLVAADADYDVILTPVIACGQDGQPLINPDGGYVYLNENKATVRCRYELTMDGVTPTYDAFVAVGNRYVVTPNREVVERALAIIGASKGDAVLDTLGVLYGGKQVFACINMGSVFINIDGIQDETTRYLVVYSGHDGKLAMCMFLTGVRAVCANTVNLGLSTAQSRFKARHTKGGMAYSVKEAQAALGLSTKWADEFTKLSNSLLSINLENRGNAMDKVFPEVFPLAPDATDRQKRTNDEIRTTVSGIWANKNNAATFGKNGYTLWNAFTEYFDHFRDGTADERALTTMNADSWVSKAKVTAQKAVLALA